MATDIAAVAALAGRRIDASNSEYVRFPLSALSRVADDIASRFHCERVRHLVCSAACGADIIALETATDLNITTTVVLPFAPGIFRETSVTDRPGAWGERFDRVVSRARRDGCLLELDLDIGDQNAFTKANKRIVEEAIVRKEPRKLVFAIWDGQIRESSDSTAELLRMAKHNGFETISILTQEKDGEP